MMKKLLTVAALGASAFALAAPAQALVVLDVSTGDATFGKTYTSTGTDLSEDYQFTLSGGATLTNGLVSSRRLPSTGTAMSDFDFTSVALYRELGATDELVTNFRITGADPAEERTLDDITLAAGTYYVRVIGDITAPAVRGSYTGQLSLMSAVPEPATWALMILGFGMVGSSLRSRRRAVVSA